MTPAQIESAAREVARLRGYDPDARADFPLPPAGAVWQVFRDEVERFVQVFIAIAAVMQREAVGVAMKTPRKKKATKGLDSRPRPV